MHKNTYILVSILAVLAALVVGVNLGKKLSPSAPPSAASTPKPSAVVTPTPKLQTFTDTTCGFSVQYGDDFTLTDSGTGSAMLENTSDTNQSVVLACQKNIPRPALPANQMEKLTLETTTGTSISGTLYHDQSLQNGSPIDALMFTHPTSKLDVFIAGYGDAFNALLKTIQVIQ